MNRTVKTILYGAIFGLCIYVWWPRPEPPKRVAWSPDFDVSQFTPRVVIPRSFPAIVNPEADAAGQTRLSVHDEELVLGVEINGQARAYPINMLTGPRREIINDELGGSSIAATW